jgi:hypothetical protein
MSMELWQRLKDLEKKVQEQGAALLDLTTRIASPQVSPENPVEARNEMRSPAAAAVSGTSVFHGASAVPAYQLCPKCGKARAYHFHVKNCKGSKGNAEVA